MLSQPMIRKWARRLIDSELETGSSSTQTELATVRVYEKLRRQLCAPVGVDAFQALAYRALSVAKSRCPTLSNLQVTADGGLQGLEELESPLDRDEDDKVGVILITQLLGLVLTLLGEAATMRLMEATSICRSRFTTCSGWYFLPHPICSPCPVSLLSTGTFQAGTPRELRSYVILLFDRACSAALSTFTCLRRLVCFPII